MKRSVVLAVALLIAGAAVASPPRITRASHHGGRQGSALRLRLTGSGLAGTRIETELLATFTALSTGTHDEIEYLVEIDRAAEPGPYALRAVGENGISNGLVFAVGLLPEVDEVDGVANEGDPYGGAESGRAIQPITPPVLVNGRLSGPERDTYLLELEAGDTWVFEVEARRLGSAIDPTLLIRDPSGRVVARVDDSPGIGVDSRLAFTAPETGSYEVIVHDSKFSYQTADFYRLKVGRFDFADGLFPLGGRRGEIVDVDWVGDHLADAKTGHIDLRNTTEDVALASLDGSTLPLPFVVGDLPETRENESSEVQKLTADLVLNGRIATPGETDRYRLEVEAGERWLFEVQAAGLGTSRLSAVVTLHDAAGTRLAAAGDQEPDQGSFRLLSPTRTTGDPFLSFEIPAGLEVLEVRIEDLVGRGGPLYGYRLVARRSAPDFRIALTTTYVNIPAGGTSVVRVAVDRHGYLGAIRLSIPDPPAGVTVRGGSIPTELGDRDGRTISRSGVLTLTATPLASPRVAKLEVWGEAVLEDGTVVRRKALALGLVTRIRQEDGQTGATAGEKPFTAPWLGLGFSAAVTPASGATLQTTAPPVVRLVKGAPLDLDWTWDPGEGNDGPPKFVVIEPVGPSELRTRTPPKETYFSKQGTIHVRTSDGTPHDSFDVIPVAVLADGGRVYGPVTTLEVVRGYRVELAEPPARIVAGASGRIRGAIDRDPSFSQPIVVRADGLPSGVACRSREVAGDASEFNLPCRADEDVEPGEYAFEILSTSWLAGDQERAEYSIDPVRAVLVVSAGEERVGSAP